MDTVKNLINHSLLHSFAWNRLCMVAASKKTGSKLALPWPTRIALASPPPLNSSRGKVVGQRLTLSLPWNHQSCLRGAMKKRPVYFTNRNTGPAARSLGQFHLARKLPDAAVRLKRFPANRSERTYRFSCPHRKRFVCICGKQISEQIRRLCCKKTTHCYPKASLKNKHTKEKRAKHTLFGS